MATSNRGGFTERTRVKASETKRLRALAAPEGDAPAVFVVRVDNGYGWEVRRFGAVVLGRGAAAYPAQDDARAAGELSLK